MLETWEMAKKPWFTNVGGESARGDELEFHGASDFPITKSTGLVTIPEYNDKTYNALIQITRMCEEGCGSQEKDSQKSGRYSSSSGDQGEIEVG